MRVQAVKRTVRDIQASEQTRPGRLREADASLREMLAEDERQRNRNFHEYRDAEVRELREFREAQPGYRDNAERIWRGDAARAHNTAMQLID